VTSKVHRHIAAIHYLTINNAEKLRAVKIKPQPSNRGERHNNDEKSWKAANQDTKWPKKKFTLTEL
jgi:hypothetical protein